MVGDAQELDLENQGLACQAVIEVHPEFIGLDGQNRSGNGAMGTGELEFLAHLDRVVLQHFLGKFPLEVIPQLAVGLIRAQGHLFFAIHFHTDDGIIKAGNDPAGAHLKLQGLAIDTAIENGAVFQATGIVQLHKIAIFYSVHKLSLGSGGFKGLPPAPVVDP
jgi:hypothetical protein